MKKSDFMANDQLEKSDLKESERMRERMKACMVGEEKPNGLF